MMGLDIDLSLFMEPIPSLACPQLDAGDGMLDGGLDFLKGMVPMTFQLGDIASSAFNGDFNPLYSLLNPGWGVGGQIGAFADGDSYTRTRIGTNWGLQLASAGLLAKFGGQSGVAVENGWRVGESITNNTAKGNVPAWSTVRQRFWKNEAFYNESTYSVSNLLRLKKGLAPQRLNPNTGLMESMELHHHILPQRFGGLFDFIKLWPEEHRKLDPFRN
jgi:hypothetical protein